MRALLPHLTSQDHALATACLALYAGKDGVDPLISKLPKSMRNEPVLAHARFTAHETRNRSSAIEMMQSQQIGRIAEGPKFGPRIDVQSRATFFLIRNTKLPIVWRRTTTSSGQITQIWNGLQDTGAASSKPPENVGTFERMLVAATPTLGAWLAQAHKKQGRTAEARKYLHRVLNIKPASMGF